jgi:RNA polymerase sigma factor (TIGR02999 family)
MRDRAHEHTLQPTALVHESFLKLAAGAAVHYESRGHFLAVAVKVMRQIVTDRARRRLAVRHGGGAEPLELNEHTAGSASPSAALFEVHRALATMARIDPRKAKVTELSCLLGLTTPEIAHTLGISEPTVKRDLKVGRAWMIASLRGGPTDVGRPR